MSSSPAAAAAQRADNSGGGGFRCCCFVMPHDAGYCVRANTLATYTQANLDVARGDRFDKESELPTSADPILAKEGNFALKSFSGDSARGFGVEVGMRSSVKKSSVGPHCKLGAGVKLTNCILMDHVVVQDKVTMSNCIVCSNAQIGEGASLKDTQVADGITIEPGATIKGEAVHHDREEDE